MRRCCSGPSRSSASPSCRPSGGRCCTRIADHVPVRWIAGPRPVPDWLDGEAIEIVRDTKRTRLNISGVSAATAYHEAVEAMRWARQLLASGRAEPGEIAICVRHAHRL